MRIKLNTPLGFNRESPGHWGLLGWLVILLFFFLVTELALLSLPELPGNASVYLGIAVALCATIALHFLCERNRNLRNRVGRLLAFFLG